MTLPGNITLTPITETYLAQNGTDTPDVYEGTVEFRPTGSIYINDPGNAIFPPNTVIGTLDATGTIKASDGGQVKLVPENDDDLQPTGWTYDVTEKLSLLGVAIEPRPYSISVPTSVAAIRLSDIAPTPPSSGTTIYVLSVAGVDPTVDGNVPLTPADIGAYVKPGGGIPESDMSAAVQTKLDAAGASGTVTEVNGVSPDGLGHVILSPSDISAASDSDLSAEVSRAEAAEAALYTKPGTGIPKSDLATSVQTSLSAADTAVQPTRTISAGTGLAGGGSLAADRTISVNVGTASGTLAAGDDSRITGAQQTSQKDTAGGYMGIDGTTGRALPTKLPLVPQIQSPTFASTITFDASTGTEVRVTLTGNLTLANPTNPSDGQLLLFVLTQDATGSRTLTLGSAFDLGTNTVTLSTAASKTDFLLCKYIAALSKWCVLAFGPGY